MKTAEMLKVKKDVIYVMTRYNGRALGRECFKKVKDAEARMKALKALGFERV